MNKLLIGLLVLSSLVTFAQDAKITESDSYPKKCDMTFITESLLKPFLESKIQEVMKENGIEYKKESIKIEPKGSKDDRLVVTFLTERGNVISVESYVSLGDSRPPAKGFFEIYFTYSAPVKDSEGFVVSTTCAAYLWLNNYPTNLVFINTTLQDHEIDVSLLPEYLESNIKPPVLAAGVQDGNHSGKAYRNCDIALIMDPSDISSSREVLSDLFAKKGYRSNYRQLRHEDFPFSQEFVLSVDYKEIGLFRIRAEVSLTQTKKVGEGGVPIFNDFKKAFTKNKSLVKALEMLPSCSVDDWKNN